MAAPALPTLFIPHGGGPCFFMDWDYPGPNPWDPLARWLQGLAATIGRTPRAVLVVSGHWEEAPVAINVQRQPPLLYDYHGFPPHTYRLTYPVPGDPELAREVAARLEAAGIPVREEQQRGLDHGVFIPFKLIYPQANVPVLQLSLLKGLDPAAHIALGAALAGLRAEEVLIVGSGMSFHNLAVRSMQNEPIAGSVRFDEWLVRAVCAPSAAQRNAALIAWQSAPEARFAHPREEHLLPLMVVAGAAGEDLGQHAFGGRMLGWQISGFYFGTGPSVSAT